jgi:hypothetical protein
MICIGFISQSSKRKGKTLKRNIFYNKLKILILSFSLFLIGFESQPSYAAEGEYSVAYWGQTHRHFALKIYHSLTPEQIQKLCTLPAQNRRLIQDSALLKIWHVFYQKKRAAFCKSHPQKTWKLLGESPYFMLPPRDGDQK